MDELDFQFIGHDGEVLLVVILATLNHESAEPLRQLVIARLPNRDGAAVVLDLRSTEMVSSIGVASLLQVLEFCKDRRAAMVLAGVSPQLQKFFRMLGIERKFAFVPSIEDALVRIAPR